MHAYDLHAINGHFFIIQNADARVLDGVEVFCGIGKLLVISQDKECPQRSREPRPGLGKLAHPRHRAVVHIAGDKDDVGRSRVRVVTMRRMNPEPRT